MASLSERLQKKAKEKLEKHEEDILSSTRKAFAELQSLCEASAQEGKYSCEYASEVLENKNIAPFLKKCFAEGISVSVSNPHGMHYHVRVSWLAVSTAQTALH
jgi:hypothetical protein